MDKFAVNYESSQVLGKPEQKQAASKGFPSLGRRFLQLKRIALKDELRMGLELQRRSSRVCRNRICEKRFLRFIIFL